MGRRARRAALRSRTLKRSTFVEVGVERTGWATVTKRQPADAARLNFESASRGAGTGQEAAAEVTWCGRPARVTLSPCADGSRMGQPVLVPYLVFGICKYLSYFLFFAKISLE